MFTPRLDSHRRSFARDGRSFSEDCCEVPRRKIRLNRRGTFFCRSPRRGDILDSDGSVRHPAIR